MIMEITNTGSEEISDDIIYSVARSEDVTPKRQELILQPGESKMVQLRPRLGTLFSNYQVWTIGYAGEWYDKTIDSHAPLFTAHQSRLITEIDQNRGSGGDFEIIKVESPDPVAAGSPIPINVTVDNNGSEAATQILNVSGPGGNDSRAMTIQPGNDKILPLSICSSPNSSDSENITVETENDSKEINISVAPGESDPCKYGQSISQHDPVLFRTPDGEPIELPMLTKYILIGVGSLIVIRLLMWSY